MRHSERRSRIAGAALGVVVTSAVAAWALAHATTRLAPAVALAGIAGIVTFTAALTAPFAPRRNRTIATGLVLVGTAVVVAANKRRPPIAREITWPMFHVENAVEAIRGAPSSNYEGNAPLRTFDIVASRMWRQAR